MPRPALVLAAFASLLGCLGVVLGAASAHVGGDELARTASLYLLPHGAALLGVAASAGAVVDPRWLLRAGFALGAGASVFSADLAARAFLGGRLFPFAAPIGGTLMIVSWLALAILFALAAARARPD